jgi:hypothetical protein
MKHRPIRQCSGSGNRARLMAAAAVLLAGAAAAGCSPTPTQAGASAAAPPESSSSPPPSANSAYPYEPAGVDYTGGEGGAVETFSIPAGTYSLNQQATYDPVNDPSGTGECLFGGELDYLPAGSSGIIALGDNGSPVQEQVPLVGQSTAPYPAGEYRLYIYPTTTCSWTVELGADS